MLPAMVSSHAPPRLPVQYDARPVALSAARSVADGPPVVHRDHSMRVVFSARGCGGASATHRRATTDRQRHAGFRPPLSSAKSADRPPRPQPSKHGPFPHLLALLLGLASTWTAAGQTLAGNVTTFVGDTTGMPNNFWHADGVGTASSFQKPLGVAMDAAGSFAIIVRSDEVEWLDEEERGGIADEAPPHTHTHTHTHPSTPCVSRRPGRRC